MQVNSAKLLFIYGINAVGGMMKRSSYIMQIIVFLLVSAFGGCSFFNNGGSDFAENDREIVSFDDDIDVWLVEEINPEHSNSPQLYLSLRPGRMYTDGYDIYATFSMIDSRIIVEVYGMLSPRDDVMYPAVMVWPEISFPVGELFGQYDLFLNYGDLTDVYRIENSGETIMMVPIETSFSRNP